MHHRQPTARIVHNNSTCAHHINSLLMIPKVFELCMEQYRHQRENQDEAIFYSNIDLSSFLIGRTSKRIEKLSDPSSSSISIDRTDQDLKAKMTNIPPAVQTKIYENVPGIHHHSRERCMKASTVECDDMEIR